MVDLEKGKRKKKDFLNFGKFFLVLVALILLFWKARSTLDPDFGWHWRMGEIILTSGIPKTDPFSYTMPSFPFVDHEWLVSVEMYLGERKLGYGFLAFCGVLLGVLTLIISLGGLKEGGALGKYKLALFVLGVGCFWHFIGVRPQVLSWFYLAVFLKIVLKEKYSWVDIFLIWGLFLVWVNTHGSFALGIFCLGVVTGVRFLKKKGRDWKGVLIFLVSFGLTLINPYKAGIWSEVWRVVSDSKLRWRIEEWRLSFTYPLFAFLFLVAFFILVYRYRKKLALEKLILGVFFLIQGCLSLRNIPLFTVFCLPLYLEIGGYVFGEKAEKEIKEKIVKGFFAWLWDCFFLTF